MLIIVNTAFDEQLNENFDDDDDDAPHAQTSDDTAPNIVSNDIELVLINVHNNSNNTNVSANSCNGTNESPVDGEELDTSDNNTTNNTQTTAECDDKLIAPLHRNGGSSSTNDDDDDSNSKDNYDMNYDYEDEEEENDGQLKRKHNEDDLLAFQIATNRLSHYSNLSDVQNIEETQKLVDPSGKSDGGDLEDCDYYSDTDNDSARVRQTQNDVLIYNRGDGIIANRFIGLYFHLVLFS